MAPSDVGSPRHRTQDGQPLPAALLWLVSVVLAGCVVAFDVIGRDTERSAAVVALLSFGGVLGLLAFTTMGALVAAHRPRNPVGWLLLASGLVWTTGMAVERYVAATDGSGPGAAVAAASIDGAGWVAGLAAVALTLLLFPSGRAQTRLWRVVLRALIASGAVLAIALLLTPGRLPSWPEIDNPFGVRALDGITDVVVALAEPVFFAGLIAALASGVVRFRRSSGVERQQMRWLAVAAGLMIVGFSIGAALSALGLPGEPWFNSIPMFAVPVAVGIAVLRYRLCDLDIVVDRTLTYGILAVGITAIYVLMVAGVGGLIGGGTRSDVGLAVLATAIAAAVFQPARQAAQAGVRRLVFRAPSGSPHMPVSIRTLGGFRVERAGRPVGGSEWQSRKARQLLKMLVARRGRPWHREQLIEALWPDAGSGNLANRLAVAASTVRAVLDPDKAHPNDHFLAGDADTLWVVLDHLWVDVDHFLAEADAGLRSRGQELWEAERMYRGDFLEEDLYEDWAQPLREEARATYLAVLRARAETVQERGTDAAVVAQLKILEVDPWDEAAHLAIVAALTEAGRHGEARRAHRRYCDRMEDIGVVPTPLEAVTGPAHVATPGFTPP
jgi:DNA-binding SARP family transcriptional activator